MRLLTAREKATLARILIEGLGLGSDFLDDVQRAIDRLSDYPHSGEAIDYGLRRTLLHRFPFSLIYVVEENSICDCGSSAPWPGTGLLAVTRRVY